MSMRLTNAYIASVNQHPNKYTYTLQTAQQIEAAAAARPLRAQCFLISVQIVDDRIHRLHRLVGAARQHVDDIVTGGGQGAAQQWHHQCTEHRACDDCMAIAEL